MLIIFKSKAGSDVIYLGEHGKAMLKLLGKDPEEKRGVVTVEQLPEAIAKFKAVIDADKAQAKETERLEEANVDALKIHGGMLQKDRELAMKRFKQKEVPYMVATDVAARGIDVSFLEISLSYDFPVEKESYVHRKGRV